MILPRRRLQAVAAAGLALWLAAGCGGHHAPTRPKPMEIRALRRAEMRSRAEIPLQPEVAGAERLEPVYFDYDRHAIRPDQRPVLARHAELLKARPEVRVVLEGHCDERGSVEYNNSLGRKRAEAVRAYLVKAGVAGDRLSVVSYGEERPIETGPDPKARARNRRVELVLSAR